MHLGRAPRDIRKHAGMGPRQADERIAPVDCRAQHDGIPILNGIHRSAQNRCRQGGAVGIDQNRSGMTGGEQIGQSRGCRRVPKSPSHCSKQAEARRQQRPQRRFGPGRRIDGIGATSPSRDKPWMVAARSRMSTPRARCIRRDAAAATASSWKARCRRLAENCHGNRSTTTIVLRSSAKPGGGVPLLGSLSSPFHHSNVFALDARSPGECLGYEHRHRQEPLDIRDQIPQYSQGRPGRTTEVGGHGCRLLLCSTVLDEAVHPAQRRRRFIPSYRPRRRWRQSPRPDPHGQHAAKPPWSGAPRWRGLGCDPGPDRAHTDCRMACERRAMVMADADWSATRTCKVRNP